MQKTSIADALRALATDDTARSETARLRDIFDDIEATLSAGVSRAAVLKTLHAQGFTMTAKSFESALYRIRKQREKKGQQRQAQTHENLDTSESEKDNAELSGLDPKQRRERIADQFINTESNNPLLKKHLNKDKK
jgi:hypothetical protein